MRATDAKIDVITTTTTKHHTPEVMDVTSKQSTYSESRKSCSFHINTQVFSSIQFSKLVLNSRFVFAIVYEAKENLI